jgi:N-dimethylarginine dimethylaminohydrolase
MLSQGYGPMEQFACRRNHFTLRRFRNSAGNLRPVHFVTLILTLLLNLSFISLDEHEVFHLDYLKNILRNRNHLACNMTSKSYPLSFIAGYSCHTADLCSQQLELATCNGMPANSNRAIAKQAQTD